jgi:hypothetical protein
MSHVGKGDIHAYLDGALGAYPEDEANRIRQHLGACEVCSRSLDEERELRLVASEILAATADAPMDLDPFEELVARAGEADQASPSGGGSTFRGLRIAATVVVSLGAGWLARDLTGPAADLATTPTLDAVREQQAAVGSRGNAPANPFQTEAENEAGGERQAGEGDFAAQVATPVQEQERNAEAPPPAARAVLSEVSAERVDAPAPARLGSADQVETGLRDVVGGALGLDQRRAAEARGRAVGEAAPTERARLEAVAPTAATDNRALPGVTGRVAPAVAEEELSKSDPDESFADDANVLAMDEMSVTGMSVTGRTSSLVIPGLLVRDVRVLGAGQRIETTVVVVQTLPDGRSVELRLEIDSDGTAARKVTEAVSDDETLPEGWNRVERSVPEGLAVIRGPLSEAELSELLDAAVGGR